MMHPMPGSGVGVCGFCARAWIKGETLLMPALAHLQQLPQRVVLVFL
ncbi:hypothetical protein V8J88_10810 [Massilia sp. W12]